MSSTSSLPSAIGPRPNDINFHAFARRFCDKQKVFYLLILLLKNFQNHLLLTTSLMLFRAPFGKSFVTIFCIALWAQKMGRERWIKGRNVRKLGQEWSRVEKIMKDWKEIAQHF